MDVGKARHKSDLAGAAAADGGGLPAAVSRVAVSACRNLSGYAMPRGASGVTLAKTAHVVMKACEALGGGDIEAGGDEPGGPGGGGPLWPEHRFVWTSADGLLRVACNGQDHARVEGVGRDAAEAGACLGYCYARRHATATPTLVVDAAPLTPPLPSPEQRAA